MLGLITDELRQTRFFRDVFREGALALLTRPLTRRCGTLSPSLLARVQSLSLEQLEELGDALLDFSGVEDLETWLAR